MGTHPIFESDFDCLTAFRMVKLTADVIAESAQHVNACRERELDLRGYKFAMIENLGATMNQYDSFMMNDNDVKKIENFPYLPRLKVLYLANNRIRKIDSQTAQNIPNLKDINLTNNEFREFGDIKPLAEFEKLEYLVLVGSPIAAQLNYRAFVIHTIPQLRVFDYKRITNKERQEAKALFGGTDGKKPLQEMKTTFTPGGELDAVIKSRKKTGMSEDEKRRIKEAILSAKSLEEVEMLQQQLQMGHVPGTAKKKSKDPDAPEEDSEEEEKMDEN